MAPFFPNRMASGGRKDAALDLMVRARGIFNVDDHVVVSVSGHDCGEPECRRARTVILIMRPDQPTKAIKINTPLEAVTAADLCAGSGVRARPIRKSRRRLGRLR